MTDATPVERVSRSEMGSRHLRGSTLLLAGRLLSMVFTVATAAILTRATTKADYGGFALALTITSASRFLLSLGQGKTLSRFLAIYLEERDHGRLVGSVLIAAGTILATGTALIVTLFAFHDRLQGAVLERPTAVTVLLVVIFLAPMEALDQVFVSLFAVFTKPRSIFFRKYLFTPVLRLVVVVVTALAGGDIVLLAAGYVATQVFGLAIYATLLRRVLAAHGVFDDLTWRTLRWPVRNVFTFALPMLSTELVLLSMNLGSSLLLGYYGSQADVADLRTAWQAAGLNKIFYTTFLVLYLPMASRLFARGDHDGLREDYWRTAAFLAVMSYPVFALTGPFAGSTAVALFGGRYASAGAVLALLAVGYYVNSALGFNLVTLQAYGKVRFLLFVNLACAALNLVLSFALIPRYGASGAAAANAAVLVLQNVAYQVGVMRTLGTAFLDRRYLPTYLSIVLVTAGLWAVQLAFDPPVWVAFLASAAASVLLVVLNRPVLALADSFPELAKIPVLRWVTGATPRHR